MTENQCQSMTKKGAPCKNKAIDGLFCKVHGGTVETGQIHKNAATEPPSSATAHAADAETLESTKTFDAIVAAGAKLVAALDKASSHMPDMMDKVFKYTGASIVAPAWSEKAKTSATERTQKRLQKLQLDIINAGSDPSKLDNLLEKTKRLEAMAANAIAYSDRHIPTHIKVELKKSLATLQEIRQNSKTHLKF